MAITVWLQSWHAPCDDLSEWPGDPQFPKDKPDRLRVDPTAVPAKSGSALRAQADDFAWNPKAQGPGGGNGAQVPGGFRAEAVGPTEHAADAPVLYSWSTMLAATYPLGAGVRFQVITQWHQGDDDQGASPPVEIIVVADRICLSLNRPDGTQLGQWDLAPADPGTWHDFRAEIRWHESDGHVRIWHDGAPVVFAADTGPTDVVDGVATLFPSSKADGRPSTYLKMGLYREAKTTSDDDRFVVYHDEVRRFEPWRIPFPFRLRLRRPVSLPMRLPPLVKPPWHLPWPPPGPERRRGAPRR